MNAPARSRRRHGVLLIWCGGVALVLGSAFTVAWLKLPEWEPEWVIEHSPWIEPAVRAMVGTQEGDVQDPRTMMDWAPAIGREFRHVFAHGELWQRERVMVLTWSLLTRQPDDVTLDDPTRFFRSRTDDSDLTPAEAKALWDDIVWLIEEASTDGRGRLRESATHLITLVPDVRWMPILGRWAAEEKEPWQFSRYITAVGRGRDPRSVPLLLSLFTEEHQLNGGGIAEALSRCLASNQVADVAFAAHHQRPQVRAWAASVIHRVMADDALRQRFLELLEDPIPQVRFSAVKAIIEQGIPEVLHAVFLLRLDDPVPWIPREVLRGILDRGVPPELRSAFITRLPGPDQGLQRAIIEAVREDLIRKGFGPVLTFLSEQPEFSLRWSVIADVMLTERGRIAPVVRQIALQGDERLRGPAIVMLGSFRQRGDIPVLFTLLDDPNLELASSAYTALKRMSLISKERMQMEATWKARTDAEPSLPASPTASPP